MNIPTIWIADRYLLSRRGFVPVAGLENRQPRAGKPDHNTFVIGAFVVVLNAYCLFTQALICLTCALPPSSHPASIAPWGHHCFAHSSCPGVSISCLNKPYAVPISLIGTNDINRRTGAVFMFKEVLVQEQNAAVSARQTARTKQRDQRAVAASQEPHRYQSTAGIIKHSAAGCITEQL